MEKAELKHSDSDEAHSPPGFDKHTEGGAPVDLINIPDPDEGLSEEERKKIVSNATLALARS